MHREIEDDQRKLRSGNGRSAVILDMEKGKEKEEEEDDIG